MSILSDRAPQISRQMFLDWITPGYQVPAVPSLPPTGTQGQFIIVGTTSSGKYYQYDSGAWVDLGPATGFKFGNLPTGTSPLQLQDTKSGNFANLFVVNVEDPAPLIVSDQGFVIKKDLAVGGNILSLQGSVIFGRGWTGSAIGTTIIAQSPPLIDLLYSDEYVKSGSSPPIVGMSNQAGQIFFNTNNNTLYIWKGNQWIVSQTNPAGGSVPKYDTLFLVKGDGYSPAHMSIGKLITHDSVYLRVAGAAGGQLMIENINASGGVLSIGVGDSGMYPYRAWIGCPYGTNGINDFAYGMFLGFPGQSTTLLSAKWANSEKMLLNQSGALTLAGGITAGGVIATSTGVALTLDSGTGGIWANNDFNFKSNLYVRQTANAVIGFYDANGNNERCSLGFNTIATSISPANSTYLHNCLPNGLSLVSDLGNIVLAPMSGSSQVIVAGGHSLNPQDPWGSGTLGNATYYWKDVYADKYRGKSDTIGLFDMVDDLKIVSEFEAETVTVKCPKTGQDIERLVISKESLKKIPGLVDEDDFYDNGNAVGFTFSCLNRLVKRVQSLETEGKRVESLEAEVRELKALLSVKKEKSKKPESAA